MDVLTYQFPNPYAGLANLCKSNSPLVAMRVNKVYENGLGHETIVCAVCLYILMQFVKRAAMQGIRMQWVFRHTDCN